MLQWRKLLRTERLGWRYKAPNGQQGWKLILDDHRRALSEARSCVVMKWLVICIRIDSDFKTNIFNFSHSSSCTFCGGRNYIMIFFCVLQYHLMLQYLYQFILRCFESQADDSYFSYPWTDCEEELFVCSYALFVTQCYKRASCYRNFGWKIKRKP